jgi:uncharacterized protein (TIGR02118 family)
MTYPTDVGVVAMYADRDSARRLAAKLAEDRSASARSVTLHTALEGHTGDFLGVVRATGEPAELAEKLADAASIGLYATTFRRVKEHAETWSVGEETPGLGLLFPVVRRGDLTHEQFDSHWRDNHAPLALRHHVGMWDYVQCSFSGSFDGSLTTPSAALDGMAICKFPTVADFKERFFDSDEGRQAIWADVARFSDPNGPRAMRMVERILR